MISIKGASGQEMVIATEQKGGYRWITAMGADIYKTADLLAALNATANADVKHRADAYQAANRAEAERDALAKTVERVRALAEKWRYKGEFGWGPWQAGEGPDPEGQVLDDAASELCAALDPEPAFVLPTEVPARIEAKREGKTYTLYLWTNGHGGSNDLIWVDEDDWTHSPSPRRLMADFTDHRLIGGEA